MPPAKTLRDHLDYIRAHPEEFGSLENTIDDMLLTDEVPQSLKERLPGIREALRDDLNNNRMDEVGFARDMITEELERLLGERAPLRRAPRADDAAFDAAYAQMFGAPQQRGGYVNVFRLWREEYIPVRNDPQMGPETENRILTGLQAMYNDAGIAVETGAHVTPPQQVVFDNYATLIAPVTANPARTPGVILRMLAALDSQLPGTGGARRSQSKKFGACVKAVRKTVKVRKGSSAEGAAIAICTKTILHPRGRTLKRYKKGRLTTQKRRT